MILHNFVGELSETQANTVAYTRTFFSWPFSFLSLLHPILGQNPEHC